MLIVLEQSRFLYIVIRVEFHGFVDILWRVSLIRGEGQCFGLLGVNGAGKTTSFKMLTGDIGMTRGSININGFDLATQTQKARQSIGYCPQFDGLNLQMTGREVLSMCVIPQHAFQALDPLGYYRRVCTFLIPFNYRYAAIRGISDIEIPTMVNAAMRAFGIEQYADRQCGTYSGGNKRKLSTAIALIGQPELIFLDEPTSGMDVGGRRYLWNTLLAAVAAGRSIVLTSHSMEECEALCTRLAIMVDGKFKCIGSAQHLKDKFGQGYVLTTKLKNEELVPAFKQFIYTVFPRSTLLDEYGQQLTFSVPGSLQVAEMFAKLETARTTHGVDDYSLNQSSLEQVIVALAVSFKILTRMQKPPEKKRGAGDRLNAPIAAYSSHLIFQVFLRFARQSKRSDDKNDQKDVKKSGSEGMQSSGQEKKVVSNATIKNGARQVTML